MAARGIAGAIMLAPSFAFADRNWQVLPNGALYWPARRALLVADLHFEKASAYAARGQMLPPYDSLATIAALDAAITASDAQEVWCLGDSLHDPAAADRMSDAVMQRLAVLTSGRRWVWITGNHDPLPAPQLGGEVRAQALVEGVWLRHEALADTSAPEISGHFHPKWRMSLRGRSVSRRCFVLGNKRLIVPAFGALAGGLDARAAPIRQLIGDRGEVLVPLPDRLLRFPLASAGRSYSR